MTRFAGYAAIFDLPDEGGDVVRKGAFRRSLARGEKVPLLLQHRGGEVGAIERIAEDRRGLRIIARLADTRGGRAVRKLVTSGQLDGLSFGYRVRRAGKIDGLRTLEDLDLVEVSLVRQPMHPKARVHAIED